MKKKPMEQSQLHTSPGQFATHRRSFGHGERPRPPRFLPVLFTMVVALVLSGCILQPDTGRTGSVTLRFTSLNASTSRDGFSAAVVGGEQLPVTAIGVFLYGPDGRERRSARVDVSGGSATIQLDDIPEGRGYTIVAVKYTNPEGASSPVPLPVAMGESSAFSISGGRETRVLLSTTGINQSVFDSRYPMEFRGERLVGAGAVGGPGIVGATATKIVRNDGGESTSLPDNIQINGIFEGKVFGSNNVVSIPLLATNQGIFPATPLPNGSPSADDIAEASFDAGASNVQEIIAFVAEEGGDEEIVWVYSRLGGFGGIGFGDNGELANGQNGSEWFDAGEDEDNKGLFNDNENPVRAMGTDGSNEAYLATGPLGTFRITGDFENVFDDDDDDDSIISEIIAGRSREGFTSFGVVPPGQSSAVRINRLGVVSPPSDTDESNRVILGTSQGAFWFSGSAIDSFGEGQSNVSGSAVNTISQLAGERIQDIAVSGMYVALATSRRVLVLKRVGAGFTEVAKYPTRGVVLGDLTRIFIGSTSEGGETKDLFISGTAGLTVIPIAGER